MRLRRTAASSSCGQVAGEDDEVPAARPTALIVSIARGKVTSASGLETPA
jgi:hypothetical protein